MYIDVHLFCIFCTYDYTDFIFQSYVLNTLEFKIVLQVISDIAHILYIIWETTFF